MSKYEKALRRILDMDFGVYPKAVHDPDDIVGYEKRTPYMEGWNAASIEHLKEIVHIFKELKIDTSDW